MTSAGQGEQGPLYDPAAYVPLTADVFHYLVAALGSQGLEDLDWAEAIQPPGDADEFARNVLFVIANSGMKAAVAARIFARCMEALHRGLDAGAVFGHAGKAAAMSKVWAQRQVLFEGYQAAVDKMQFLRALPFIGPITVLHLAKNFGVSVAKPDLHLVRLAQRDGSTVQQLCERLALETGYKVATIDTILWRACSEGVLDSRTGLIPSIGHLNALRTL